MSRTDCAWPGHSLYRLLFDAEEIEHEDELQGGLLVAPEAAGGAAVAGMHIDREEQGVIVGF